MIKAVVFDLDNTLLDFMKMKRVSIKAAISSMLFAGLDVDKEKAEKANEARIRFGSGICCDARRIGKRIRRMDPSKHGVRRAEYGQCGTACSASGLIRSSNLKG